MTTGRKIGAVLGLAIGFGLAACDGTGGGTDGGPAGDASSSFGDVVVIVEAEDTITDGLMPGITGEAIQDGWAVSFERYIAVLGSVNAQLSTDEAVSAEDTRTFAVDLSAVPESGLSLFALSGLRTGRWEFNYAQAGAGGATRHESVSEAHFTEMRDSDWTYLISGTMSRADGQSCPPATLASPGAATPNGNTNAGGDACYDNPSVTFRFGVGAETAYGPCEVDEMPGFAVTEGAGTTVAITIHGDHIFFNGFPEGDEGGVTRLAQWLADCDLNLDGGVTLEELESIAPADLAELDGRFQLGGSPITPLTNMATYLSAQLKTQGHFQGEGECAIDGGE